MNQQSSPETDLKKESVSREVAGAILKAEVSPCSWMNSKYGFQIKVTMSDGGGNAFVHEKELAFADATVGDMSRLLETIGVISCVKCSKPAFDPDTVRTNREKKCERCFMGELNAEFEKGREKAARRMAKNDEKYKKQGYTHRVDAWIHRDAGDDVAVSYYMKDPTDAQIQAELRKARSVVLNDYKLVQL
ncbi:hypothetical protein [Burkholderia vietnamiensis]|uniref:hypothetical protein n=1 Tax=Burkholderia vietnamiensis TaxID=60552 RepID=UPI00158AFE8A|nr:hypothetical protein [Burkholderia vietnamiensis]